MEPPDNRPLLDALDGLFASPDRMRPVLEAFVASTLIVAEDEDGPLTVDAEQGEYVALFTDLLELNLFEAGSRWTTMTGEEIVRRIARDEIDGFVVNPAGTSFELSREDVLDFFEID
jgi:hypothetical protein